ncbi:MAG: TfoX/Sxy family protein [Bacteroidetes bacterium]|nr:TfoX/Sxy family protein [Bacteroidota bacterium]MDA1119650.1 TfoX/Sxy family protein [Bacteroidota bacterium]
MAYNEFLADRIRQALNQKKIQFIDKKMMGGLCYMIDDKMCLGIVQDQLMARIDPEIYEQSLSLKGCLEMDFTGRAMKGFVYISPEGIDLDTDLDYWINLALEFNPKAKSSKKKIA